MDPANINDVAQLAGVSSATVSRALRGLPSVAAETRRKVETAANELDYQINRQASGLATGRTLTVGLVAPWLGTWYTSQVIAGAERVLVKAGYDLLVASVPVASFEPFLNRARSFGQRVDGTILIDVFAQGKDLARLQELGGSVVALGESVGRFPSISIDNRTAAQEATRHLLELGHRRIGLVRGSTPNALSSPVPDRREAGWREAHEAVGVPIDPSLIVDGHDDLEGGQAALHSLWDLTEHPTAVFCMSDQMAFGLMAAAQQRRISVPEDLSVIGFDDHTFAAAFGLTTMRQDIVGMGFAAASILAESINGASPDPVAQVTPVTLVIRETTAPPSGC